MEKASGLTVNHLFLNFLIYYFRPILTLMGEERRARLIAPLVPEAWSWSGCGLCAACQGTLPDVGTLICKRCESLLIKKVNEPYLWLHSISFFFSSILFAIVFFNPGLPLSIEKFKFPIAFLSIFFFILSINAAIKYYKFRRGEVP